MTGIERLRQWLAERGYQIGPVMELMGFGLVEVGPGHAVFAGTPGPRHYNPMGSVHGGYAATLLDSCMACAVQTLLPSGASYTTIEITINYVRAISDQTGELRAVGTAIHVGRRMGTAEGRLVDAEGKLFAHGTTTCMIFPAD